LFASDVDLIVFGDSLSSWRQNQFQEGSLSGMVTGRDVKSADNDQTPVTVSRYDWQCGGTEASIPMAPCCCWKIAKKMRHYGVSEWSQNDTTWFTLIL